MILINLVEASTDKTKKAANIATPMGRCFSPLQLYFILIEHSSYKL